MEMVLQAKDTVEWAYMAERAVNLVLAYCGNSPKFIGKALRIQKVSGNGSEYGNGHSALTKHEYVLWGEVAGIASAPTREIVEQLCVQQIMCPLLGSEHVDAGKCKMWSSSEEHVSFFCHRKRATVGTLVLAAYQILNQLCGEMAYWDCDYPLYFFMLGFVIARGLWSSCGDERIIVFTTNHKDRLDSPLLRPGRMDFQLEMSYCTSNGFKTLAANYLKIEEHRQFAAIEELLTKVKVTPAEVAGELMKSEDADIALLCCTKLLLDKEKIQGKTQYSRYLF